MAAIQALKEKIAVLEDEVRAYREQLQYLEASEAKFRHFFQKSPIMIYVTDRAGVFLNINEAGVRLMGFSTKQEVIGLKAQDYFFADLTEQSNYVNILNRHEAISEFETQMHRKDGTVIDVQMTAALRKTITGKTDGYEGFVINITARKHAEKQTRQSEEKYRTVLENSLSGIYMFQDGGIFSYVNPRMVDLLGYDSADEIIGRRFWEVIAPEDRAVVKERGLQREKTEIYPRRYVFRLLKKDGSVLWADMQGAHASYMGQRAVVGNFIDITRRMNAEKEVSFLSRKLIEGIEEERRSLAADLHDEFGQKLTLLQLDMERLQTSLHTNTQEADRVCSNAIEKIQTLADSVRNTTSRLRPEVLDHLGLITTIEWYINDFKQVMPGLAIEFEAIGFKRRLAEEIEIVLYRVFQEGLNNIAKHADAQNVQIILTCSHPKVILTMKDDGKGFAQPERDMSSDFLKEGIGLLSMKERVAAVGGEIKILSTPGGGTAIRAELPMEREVSA